MLHLARKAFYPARPPFPLLHVDTTWKFRAMYEFRDAIVKETGMELLVHVNEQGVRDGVGPFSHGARVHAETMKTRDLRQVLQKHGSDSVMGVDRREEEHSTATETGG